MKRKYYIFGVALIWGLSLKAQQHLTLEQVQQLAVEHNINMRTADNSIQQAIEQKKEAYTLYFPTISATGFGFKVNHDMIRKDISTSDFTSSLAQAISQNPSLAALAPALAPLMQMIPSTIPIGLMNHGVMSGIEAVQPVFAGGQIVNGNKLAKINIEAKQLQKLTSKNSVELQSEKYYWQIVTLKEKQKTLNEVFKMLKNLEKDATIAVKAGVGMRNDLLAVQLKENEIESDQIKLENGLKLSKMVLAQYVGMDNQDIDVISKIDTTIVPDYPAIKVDHNSAVANTPEYQLLQKNVEAKSLQHKIEIGKNMPSVAVGAGYNYYNVSNGLNNNFGAVFATVSIPISSWWGGFHAIRRSKLAETNAKEQLSDNAQLLKIRMQKDWNDVDDAYKQLLLAKRSIEQSEENLRLNRNYYHAGTVTMNDLLDAQQKYQQCRDKYTDAYSDLQTKILEYKQSIGE